MSQFNKFKQALQLTVTRGAKTAISQQYHCCMTLQFSFILNPINESASRGYIYLLRVPDHFDVLLGIDGAPIVPTAAYTHGMNWNTFPASGDVWQHLQCNYCFQHVFHYPANFTGVTLVNSPLVPSTSTSNRSTDTERDNTAQPKKTKKTVYTCDHPTCNYVGDKSRAVAMHKKKVQYMKWNRVFRPYLSSRKHQSKCTNVVERSVSLYL